MLQQVGGKETLIDNVAHYTIYVMKFWEELAKCKVMWFSFSYFQFG